MLSVLLQDVDSLITTALVFAVISVSVYFMVLRPILDPSLGDASENHDRRRTATTPTRRTPRPPPTQTRAARSPNSEELDGFLSDLTRAPPHVSESSASMLSSSLSSSLLSSDTGLVAFRHTKAAQVGAAVHRKERVAVLTKLLGLLPEDSSSSPPARGSTFCVSIPREDVKCSKLREVLYLLATYYNLLVILDVPEASSDSKERSSLIQGLRQGDWALAPEILPDHRIVASTTVAGRIAFVRQLNRVEVVLDYDPQVKTQLGRFGYRVFLYGQSRDNNSSISRLGRDLGS